MLNPKTTPKANPFISLWQVDHKIGLGIFREIDSNGDITLYCYLDEQKRQFEYKHYYTPGPVSDFTIKIATNIEKSIIIEELNGVNLHWQGKLKRFEPIDLRKVPGKKYYYMSSCGRIKIATEEGRDVDNRRFKIGNYFHCAEGVEEFKRHLILTRNDHLIGALCPD
jgi:hypothetical protein